MGHICNILRIWGFHMMLTGEISSGYISSVCLILYLWCVLSIANAIFWCPSFSSFSPTKASGLPTLAGFVKMAPSLMSTWETGFTIFLTVWIKICYRALIKVSQSHKVTELRILYLSGCGRTHGRRGGINLNILI